MHKKNISIAQSIGLTAGWLLSFCIPCKVEANAPTLSTYMVRTITIQSTGAIAPTARYPYLRLMKWLTPTTHSSLIYNQINLAPGAMFDAKTVASIRQRLMALPYFSTVSITYKVSNKENEKDLYDLIIETKDRFPIAVDLSLDEGPLLTIRHDNAWGYGHHLSHELFLKKRWGYGLVYELPSLNGNYFFGGQNYNQRGNGYRFHHQNLWVGKLFTIPVKEACYPYYWITALSGYKKQFAACPPVSAMQNRPYHNYLFLLGKIGWVADGYETIRGVYSLNALEELPKGGSIEMLYGYQKGAFHNRHYIGINCIKNIASLAFRYLHLSCASGAFLHKNRLEEAILRLALAYAGPPIRGCNGMRQFIAVNYIIGYRMPKERMLAIMPRDPEALEEPDDNNRMQTPIHARLNVELDGTLHMPIVVHGIRFSALVFTDFIALYSGNNKLLNQTWVDRYGIGVQLEHLTMSWPGVTLKMGYSPLLGKVVPSIHLAIGHFKNTTTPKPTVVAYN